MNASMSKNTGKRYEINISFSFIASKTFSYIQYSFEELVLKEKIIC